MQTANTELCAAKEQALVALREKEEALKKAEENLEVERAERKDESKRLSDAR